MKTSLLLPALLIAGSLTGHAARAADPQPPQASAADFQALVALLNKIVVQSAPAAEPAPAGEPVPAPAGRPPLPTALRTGSLAPSAGLGGRGAGTVVRLTDEAWRLLFPAKPPGS